MRVVLGRTYTAVVQLVEYLPRIQGALGGIQVGYVRLSQNERKKHPHIILQMCFHVIMYINMPHIHMHVHIT